MQHKKQNEKAKTNAGFTLVEMFIVISIFAIMASVVLFKFRDFNKSAALDNLAQDIALRVVQAQKSAISGVLPTPTPSGGTTPPSYGIYFRSNTVSDATDNKFIYFTDTDSNKLYLTTSSAGSVCHAPFSNECLSVTTMTNREYISRICYNAIGSSTYTCSPTSAVQISFVRPFPDAHIKFCASAASCSNTPPAIDAQSVYVEVSSGIDTTLKKTIVITNLGEVRVFNGCAGKAYPGGTTC